METEGSFSSYGNGCGTMPVQFAVLASGSRGNAALVQSEGAGLLVDAGLTPRKMAERLGTVGSGWHRIACVLLTHTHGDHVHNPTLHWMAQRRVALVCHDAQRALLAKFSGYHALDRLRLVRTYDDRPFLSPTGLRVEPVRLRHDCGPTYGFRIEGKTQRRGGWVGLGYVADTGTWSIEMAESLVDVNTLAIEFNHDVELQRRSGRPPELIARVLGDLGHLSNEQGAGLVAAVLARSRPRSVQNVVLLHLSEECNRPGLAIRAAEKAVRSAGRRVPVMAAQQSAAYPHLCVPALRRAAGSVLSLRCRDLANEFLSAG
jgi:phosphoribosyl 1,2-cyclic phosphodiesterase